MKCTKCGGDRPQLQRDHIVPRHLGGTDDAANIQLICANCHEDKTLAEHRARPVSAATRAKLSAALIGSKRALGYRHTQEAKAKMSLAHTGNKYNLGRKASPETRAKIGAASLGHTLPPEARAKISAAMQGNKRGLGYKHTPESLAKIGAASRLTHERRRSRAMWDWAT